MFERKLAQSVQRDYLEAAEQHRLLKECGTNSSYTKTVIKAGLALTTVALAFIVSSQLGIF
jgi:hypothetical protein